MTDESKPEEPSHFPELSWKSDWDQQGEGLPGVTVSSSKETRSERAQAEMESTPSRYRFEVKQLIVFLYGMIPRSE